MADILVKQGQPIPLVVVLSNGSATKIVTANLYDQSTGALLTTSPLTLSLVVPGYYQSNSFPMPVVNRIVAIYQILDQTNFAFQFNALLVKLDNDGGLSDHDYDTLGVATNDPLSLWLTNFNAILGKLDADMGTGDKDYGSLLSLLSTASLNDLVTNFNQLLVKLDADTGVSDSDYYIMIHAGLQMPSIDTENTGSDVFTLDTSSGESEVEGVEGGAVSFFLGAYADFLFLSDLQITTNMISISYIQEDEPASVTSHSQEPFLNLEDTTLTVVPNCEAPLTFQFPCIASSLEVASFLNDTLQASGITGVSGFVATAENGFVVLSTNNTGFSASIEVTVPNTSLGFTAGPSAGSGQQKVTLLDVPVEVKASGDEQMVSFLLSSDNFVPGELYFVEFNNGVNKSIQKFTVRRKKNSGTANFVSEMP